jgi:hypothetical protein
VVLCRAQYTIGNDHPYSREAEETAVKDVTMYICEICAKVIFSAYNFNRHMRSHFRFSAVICNFCGIWIYSFEQWTTHRTNCVSANEKNT